VAGGGRRSPLRRTKPSTTGITLAVLCPTSMTSAVPLPAANLGRVSGRHTRPARARHARVQDARVRDVERGDAELLERDLRHALAVRGRVPRGLRREQRVRARVDAEHVAQRVRQQRGDRREVLDCTLPLGRARGAVSLQHALMPLRTGDATSMPGRQRPGPCWPMYIFTLGAGGGGGAPSSPIATSGGGALSSAGCWL
jgi:hypothetical protein